MDFQPDIGAKPSAGAGLWTLLSGLVGFLFWAQLLMLPFAEELQFSDQRAMATFAYVLPLFALFPAVIFRWPMMSLLIFPASFIPGVLLLPELSVIELQAPFSMLRLGATFVVYLALAGFASNSGDGVHALDTIEQSDLEEFEGIYPAYFAVRVALLVAFFGVLCYAVLADASVTEAIGAHYLENPMGARVFIALFSFFVWCVAAYTMWFLPAMNFEYDVRRMSRRIDEMVESERTPIYRRLAVWVAICLTAGLAALLI
ncbi:MAG: hypothetical protein ACQEVA_03545 [Myxococcota bacterium]